MARKPLPVYGADPANDEAHRKRYRDEHEIGSESLFYHIADSVSDKTFTRQTIFQKKL